MVSKEVQDAIDSLPKQFGLKGFPGKTFRVAADYCYRNEDSIQIVVEVLAGNQWLHFSRASVQELQSQITK